MKYFIRTFLLIIFTGMGVMLHAGSADKWLVFFNDSFSFEDAAELSASGKHPGKAIAFELDKNGEFIANFKDKRTALLLKKLEVPEDGIYDLGFSCDWACVLFCNGEKLLAPRGTTDVSIYTGIYPVKLKKGTNFLVCRMKKGFDQWSFACRLFTSLPKLSTAEMDKFLAYRKEKNVQLAHAVQHSVSENGSFRIIASFNAPTAAGIRFEGKTDIHWTMTCGQKTLLRDHIFTVDPAKYPGGISYEIVRLNEAKPAIESVHRGKITALPKGDHQLFATGDLQLSNMYKSRIVRNFVQNALLKDCDILVALGDMSNDMDFFKGVYFSTFLDQIAAENVSLPLVPVRGNHEYRGRQTADYFRFFGTPYFSFRIGETFYIVLDAGEDASLKFRPDHFSLRTDTAEYMKEQQKWLLETINSEACRTARCRIVLCHVPPFKSLSNYYYRQLKEMTSGVFFGEKPTCPINLWLCGHQHRQLFYNPAENSITGDLSPRYKGLAPEDIRDVRFPVFVIDGPGGKDLAAGVVIDVSSKNIRIISRTPEGRITADIDIPVK